MDTRIDPLLLARIRRQHEERGRGDFRVLTYEELEALLDACRRAETGFELQQ